MHFPNICSFKMCFQLYFCLDSIHALVCLFVVPAGNFMNCLYALGPIYCKDNRLEVTACVSVTTLCHILNVLCCNSKIWHALRLSSSVAKGWLHLWFIYEKCFLVFCYPVFHFLLLWVHGHISPAEWLLKSLTIIQYDSETWILLRFSVLVFGQNKFVMSIGSHFVYSLMARCFESFRFLKLQ